MKSADDRTKSVWTGWRAERGTLWLMGFLSGGAYWASTFGLWVRPAESPARLIDSSGFPKGNAIGLVAAVAWMVSAYGAARLARRHGRPIQGRIAIAWFAVTAGASLIAVLLLSIL